MKLGDVFDPPIPEDFEDCRSRVQKRRWAADRALKRIIQARELVELSGRLSLKQMCENMSYVEGVVEHAKRDLNAYPEPLAASLILLKWQPFAELDEPTEEYFRRQTAILERAIRRLRINRFSLSESFFYACFGSPEPLSF